ncbi:dihydrofolate reductase family protein [Mycoplasmatota bacterium WC30]
MRNVILNVAISYDGYISREDGTVDFLGNPDLITDDLLVSFLKNIDVVIMGRTTYDQYNRYGWDYLNGKRIIVLSSKAGDSDQVEFYNGDVVELVKSLDCGIWCFGGGKVIKAFLDADLIDVFHITTMPTIIGRGIRLFEPGDYSYKLELISTEEMGSMVTHKYKVKK